MSTPSYVPPLNVLRDAMIRRLKCIKNTSSPLAPADESKVDALISALNTSEPTPDSLVATALMTPNSTHGLIPLKPLKSSDPLDYTCLQFGQGNLGWHFLFGNFGSGAFTLMFFRTEITTPAILQELDIDPADGVIYTISAGFGTAGGPWTTLPPTNLQGIYICGDQSFSFKALPDSHCPWLQNFTLSQNKGLTQVSLSWLPTGSSDAVGYTATLTPAKAPIFQGPKGCLPCAAGLGTLYWSYTNMTVNASIGSVASPISGTGVGWYDHQWMGIGGSLDSKLLQLLALIQGTFQMPKVIRWLWLPLQLPNDLQYMISIILDDLPQVGHAYKSTTMTTVRGNEVSYNDSAIVKVEDMAQIGNQSFPTKYTIDIGGTLYTLQAGFGLSGVYLPSGILNWEGPGIVFDINGKQIGTGLLEANQLDTSQNLISIPGTRAGLEPNKFTLFGQKKTSAYSGILAISILVLSIVFIILALIFTGKGVLYLYSK